jgi:hypothetical protein
MQDLSLLHDLAGNVLQLVLSTFDEITLGHLLLAGRMRVY